MSTSVHMQEKLRASRFALSALLDTMPRTDILECLKSTNLVGDLPCPHHPSKHRVAPRDLPEDVQEMSVERERPWTDLDTVGIHSGTLHSILSFALSSTPSIQLAHIWKSIESVRPYLYLALTASCAVSRPPKQPTAADSSSQPQVSLSLDSGQAQGLLRAWPLRRDSLGATNDYSSETIACLLACLSGSCRLRDVLREGVIPITPLDLDEPQTWIELVRNGGPDASFFEHISGITRLKDSWVAFEIAPLNQEMVVYNPPNGHQTKVADIWTAFAPALTFVQASSENWSLVLMPLGQWETGSSGALAFQILQMRSRLGWQHGPIRRSHCEMLGDFTPESLQREHLQLLEDDIRRGGELWDALRSGALLRSETLFAWHRTPAS